MGLPQTPGLGPVHVPPPRHCALEVHSVPGLDPPAHAPGQCPRSVAAHTRPSFVPPTHLPNPLTPSDPVASTSRQNPQNTRTWLGRFFPVTDTVPLVRLKAIGSEPIDS